MEKALELNIKGIKCDVCDYKAEDVKVEDYSEWLNKPCPKCGANLLTQEDFDTTMMLLSMVNHLNEILPPPKQDEEVVTANIEMNGTGSINFNIEDEKTCLNFDDNRSDCCCCCEGYDIDCHDYISESNKSKINIGVIGHVGHGKSTLVEALLKHNKNND